MTYRGKAFTNVLQPPPPSPLILSILYASVFLSSAPLLQPQPADWRDFFFSLPLSLSLALFLSLSENKTRFSVSGAIYSAQIADIAERQQILQRCTDEKARTGPVTNCHNKAHKFASESGTFYFSVLPCSQCRSGEIIGRREQLQRGDRERERERRRERERKELAAHDHTGSPVTDQLERS